MLTPISSPAADTPHLPPLLRLGFRPFYLLAALFATLSIPLWLGAYAHPAAVAPQLNLLWHMHEMVFGFAAAVVVGFLYTAARNWTGQWTPRGWPLAGLAALWLLGRAAMLLPHTALNALLDLLFVPAATAPLVRLLWRSGKRRNLPLTGLLMLLALANLAFHANLLGWWSWPSISAVEAAVLVLAVLSSVMGGRVIPGFTANMAPGSAPRSYAWLDRAGIALMVGASAAWVAGLPALPSATLAAAAGAVQLARLGFWSPQRTARYPLLWILHLAYAWIGGGYLLLAVALLGSGSASTAMHAIAVGGMSSLILGMVTRTAIGHTGRPMRAEHHEQWIFLAVQAAATARVLANLAPDSWRTVLLLVAGAGWSAAFGLYLAIYGPFLSAARVDGRDG
ncbi:NnrS family protein [Duganella callida]|uniref:NnrS family protein n=1 Tax=Duganella callida TaxID=2561932 RepID=A0A4Y9SEQ3_9BURK|nr:NnrS family protein [Duganella callida]TFW21441.1 NnrS family protein [Duganella callida]